MVRRTLEGLTVREPKRPFKQPVEYELAVEKVDESIARPFQFAPVSFDGKVLTVAMADPMNKSALDDVRFTANCEVKGVVVDPEQVTAFIEKAYGAEENVMASIRRRSRRAASRRHAPSSRPRSGARGSPENR